jgi:hypothetical protein
MADAADLVVLEPGEAEQSDAPPIPRLAVDLEVAFGERRSVRLDITEAGIGSVCDVLHRIGGEPLLRELSHALSNRVHGPNFNDARLASTGIRIAEQHTTVLRNESMAYLEALDAAARQLFEYDLTLAAVALQPQSFGFEVDQDGNRSVPDSGLAHDLYRQLRSVVAVLDALRRNVLGWANIPLPANAREARRQFKELVLGPYTESMATAAEMYPALLVMAPPILGKLAKESPGDIASWEADEANTTRLDEIIQTTVVEAFTNLREEQPDFRDNVLRAADDALRIARMNVARYWEDSPAQVLGRLHPLWKHPFLVHAAMEQQGYRPGDHGYAVGIDSLDAAMAAEERKRQEAAEIDRVLGWASLGFGLLGMVPVVGQLALAAMIAVTAIQTLKEAQRYFSETGERQALGHQAVRYQVPEPDALGLILGVLQLLSDAALPMVGQLLSKTVLRPTTRVMAATRVKTILFVGERAADLAGFVITANAALVERELRHLQILTVETGRK